MPRLVVPRSAGFAARAFEGAPQTRPGDDYKDRLVKYIPAESVALYAGCDKTVGSHFGLQATALPAHLPPHALYWSAGIFLLGLIGTPIYLYGQRIAGQPWRLNTIISTFAYVFWAYTLGGTIFVLEGWYDLLVAGMLAPIFTFVAGFAAPKPH